MVLSIIGGIFVIGVRSVVFWFNGIFLENFSMSMFYRFVRCSIVVLSIVFIFFVYFVDFGFWFMFCNLISGLI